MHPIFPQPSRPAPLSLPAPLPITMAPVSAVPALWQQDRIGRLTDLCPEEAAAGLLWLAVNFPAVCDAMLDKLQDDDSDETGNANLSQDPEPFCAECGADIGIFLRFGLDWRHYRGDGSIIGQIELFDPGHAPVVAWRLTSIPATR